ncbi:hypothetical protein ACQP2P_15805 [Dactylosporangium sp. CA-139114]|uniref:hypothetical protein n=1 Tax=Dactylosporangium sp. CA-139114 TaxID=3239931 RepID=UPI003D983E0E
MAVPLALRFRIRAADVSALRRKRESYSGKGAQQGAFLRDDGRMPRLQPTQETLRTLYLHSGNECAYPDCTARIINDAGIYIAQLAHIEAAERGGPRYNASQTDEERRSAENLLFLCYVHHKVTDAPEYTVAKLRQLKKDHESRFGEAAIARLADAVQDLTKQQQAHGAFSLSRLADFIDLPNRPVELPALAQEMRAFAAQLADLPREHRGILAIILEKGKSQWGNRSKIRMQIHELEARAGVGYRGLYPHLKFLEEGNFVELDIDDPEEGVPRVSLRNRRDFENPLWELIKSFCDASNISVLDIVVDLDFSSLD